MLHFDKTMSLFVSGGEGSNFILDNFMFYVIGRMRNPETKTTLGYDIVQRQANENKNTEN